MSNYAIRSIQTGQFVTAGNRPGTPVITSSDVILVGSDCLYPPPVWSANFHPSPFLSVVPFQGPKLLRPFEARLGYISGSVQEAM